MPYKKNLTLDFHALIQNNIDLKLSEHVVLTWAYEAAWDGTLEPLEDDGIRYYCFTPKGFRDGLPTLKIKTDRGIRKIIEKLVKQDLLVPHYNRQGIGAYYAFSPITQKLFKGS
ncbi:hypothetical protein [Microscilla marina]|uniref:Uncharacterized protein n=1 Tax=Microscilla marina ATCC 23134 TaxID=313606 RepID=A1ZEI3_MICM2|nr:hypothetical protein [Microscilla marina]EAY30935.1 hypothetical protein M23134_07342 [Microscilla marina ATCC 23134]